MFRQLKVQIASAVIIPTILSLALLFWFNSLQDKAQNALINARRYSQTLLDLSEMDRTIFDLFRLYYDTKLNSATAFEVLRSVKIATQKLDIPIEKLKVYSKSNPETNADVEHCIDLKKNIDKTIESEAAGLLSGSYSADDWKDHSTDIMHLAFEVTDAIPKMEKSIQAAARREYEKGERAKATQSWIIVLLGVTNVLTAGFAAYILSSRTSRSLDRLKKNVSLFKHGVEMEKPPEGAGEIESIENTFYMTALQLRDAQQHQKDLVSMFTHDLRGPLTVMNLSIDVLVEKEELESVRPQVARLKTNLQRMRVLIEDLLDLYKLDAGMHNFAREVFDLQDAAATVYEEMEEFAQQLKVKLTWQKKEIAVPVCADPRATARIIANLVGNAIKHSPAGKEVTITCTNDGAFGKLAIQDQGRGIAKSEQKDLFERFTQTSSAKNSRIPGLGSGLGLALCKQFTDQQKGTLVVESEENEGAQFTLRLPRGRR